MAKKFIDLVKVIPLFGNLKDVARGGRKDFPGRMMQESFGRGHVAMATPFSNDDVRCEF